MGPEDACGENSETTGEAMNTVLAGVDTYDMLGKREPQNEKCFEIPRVTLGPYASFDYRGDTKHLLFTLARYKFVAKMLAGMPSALEIGCGDGVGMPIVAETVGFVHGIDIDAELIMDNCMRMSNPCYSFAVCDITVSAPRHFGCGAYALDMIEHVSQEREQLMMANICKALGANGVCIIGTPNAAASAYASAQSIPGHINLKTHDDLRCLMRTYFNNVFMFGMNDEVVHCGYGPMCHYLFAVGAGVRQRGTSADVYAKVPM